MDQPFVLKIWGASCSIFVCVCLGTDFHIESVNLLHHRSLKLFATLNRAIKMLRLRALVGLLSYFATRRNQKMTLLVATTGDTGPAAVKAVSDIDNPLLTILVHYPQGQISNFQRKQLTTIQSPCVQVVAFEGGGDDMDRPIKNLQALRQQNVKLEDGLLTGVNSYNIARPLMQMVHYVRSLISCQKIQAVQF